MTEQTWHPPRYAQNARFVPELGRAVLEWLDPRPGERVLDLGCGDGTLTRELLDAGCNVVGIDSSDEQVAAAFARGIDARVADARQLEFDIEFDAVFSNAALHWIKPPEAVVAGVRRALKPGGRFVGESGGAGNVARIERALREALSARGIDPESVESWYFPTPEEYQTLLEAHGFLVERIELIPRPTPLPTDMAGWLATFGERFTSAVPTTDRDEFVQAVVEAVRSWLFVQGRWFADYVRLRFRAVCSKTSG